MNKKAKKGSSVITALRPTDTDIAYYGEEPVFIQQPDTEQRRIVLSKSLNWYNKFYSRKEAKDLLIQYLDHIGKTDVAKTIKKVDDSEIMMSLCWIARLKLRGLELLKEEENALETEVARLIKCVTAPEQKISMTGAKKIVEKEPVVRPNVQEIMKEKCREAGGELEGNFDQFLSNGATAKFTTGTIDQLTKKNVLPQHVSILVDAWKKKLNEFEEVAKGKDIQFVEAYGHYTKTQIKNIIKYCEQVLSDLNGYISVKKSSKAPRKRKAVPVERTVLKLKYLKEYKDTESKLDLVSLNPTKLHGASECYLYDTAKRKLIYICADEYSKTLTVKGTTILGFDKNKSQMKTVRKPGQTLPALLKSGKPASRKLFDDIKAVSTITNGRTNANMIILKAW